MRAGSLMGFEVCVDAATIARSCRLPPPSSSVPTTVRAILRPNGRVCLRSRSSPARSSGQSIEALALQLRSLKAQILEFDRKILQWHRSNELSKRLDDIPGVGPALATALVASIGDPKSFRSGRDFSAWIGLVPKQHSSGGKPRLGGITKQGDRYLRSLFTIGALAVI